MFIISSFGALAIKVETVDIQWIKRSPFLTLSNVDITSLFFQIANQSSMPHISVKNCNAMVLLGSPLGQNPFAVINFGRFPFAVID